MARGYLTLAVVGGFLLAADVLERVVVAPVLWAVPARRTSILTAWMRWVADTVLNLLRFLGGVRLDLQARIPGNPGVLVIGNHQSLLDIPVVVQAITGCHPRIVTRRRYARGVPLVSHMLRLSRAPLVDPKEPLRGQLDALSVAARTAEQPLVIFPEGHRSRDGRLRPFKRAGLGAILAARDWTVHLIVVDGFWRAGQFRTLPRTLSDLRGKAVSIGPFAWPNPGADVQAFVDEMERRMAVELERMRGEAI